ncbi:MAG: glycosyltransferase family 2 protein [Prevotella sp.]|nr:glycosyltransferase family 2 protein [Prevotella sp.]
MKVSVLVPVYGVENYIGQCAESLFSQSFQDIEYIFVDDSTPDRSIEVLLEVLSRHPSRQPQVRIIRQDRNRGLGAARLKALQNATSEYVMHVDSDDDLPIDAVEKLYQRITETGADVEDGGYAETCNGEVIRTFMPAKMGKERYLKRMLCQNIVSNRIWGRIYRRSLFTENQVFPVEGIDYSEDFCVVPRLLLHAQRAWIDDVVYLYRNDNSGSYTHQRSEKNMLSMFRAQALVNEHFQNNDPEGIYSTALQIGTVNAYREAVRNGAPLARADEVIGYVPRGIMPRLCMALLRSRCPMSLFNIVYLAWRRLYVWFLK